MNNVEVRFWEGFVQHGGVSWEKQSTAQNKQMKLIAEGKKQAERYASLTTCSIGVSSDT